MTPESTTALCTDTDLAAAIAAEYVALADLLEAADPVMWDAPSLCEGWRTREVVAHMTMPARYSGPEFMAELEAARGDFTRLSDTIAARDGALPAATLLSGLRSDVLHGWQPPGGGMEGALTHCVIHALDIMEAVPIERRVPEPRIARVLEIVAGPGSPSLFGVDLSDVAVAGRRPGLVVRVRRARHRTGAGVGPGGVRPAIAPGPARRRWSRALHAGLS